MNLKITITLLLFQVPFFMLAQNEETFEIQADKVDLTSNTEIQIFYEKFNSWTKSLNKDSSKSTLENERMVMNFIIFSEDGLLMKDLNFHTVKSCKEQVLANLPNSKKEEAEAKWIYVSMESHVNKKELIEILSFLRKEKIDYHFGIENKFVPKIIKNR